VRFAFASRICGRESTSVPTANRRIRVFISSTFLDTISERDEPMTHAWPELRRFCRERQVARVEVDLRFRLRPFEKTGGYAGQGGIAEEQNTRKETLKLCLDEIRAGRPSSQPSRTFPHHPCRPPCRRAADPASAGPSARA
jgi:hypothetical protein